MWISWTNRTWQHVLLTLCLTVGGSLAVYEPVLNFDLCSPSRIRVTLSGAADGGIIYLKGYGAACKQETFSTETQHEFDFASCGIVAETYFTMIVQKNPLYQTGNDLQESLLCIYDLSDITVSNNLNVGDKADDEGINKTVKPAAQMKLYKGTVDVSGSDVKLTNLVTMTIQLENEFIDDFDIKAKTCTANFLEVVSGFCSPDEELFPNFVSAAQGALTSSFGAFRTTELTGGYVQMVFSCTVQVCLGPCTPADCGGGLNGWGRKKREASDVVYDDLSVGASFSVGTDIDIVATDPTRSTDVCISNLAFIISVPILTAIFVTSMALTMYVTSKLLRKGEQLQDMEDACLQVQGKIDATGNQKKRRRSSIMSAKTSERKHSASDVIRLATPSGRRRSWTVKTSTSCPDQKKPEEGCEESSTCGTKVSTSARRPSLTSRLASRLVTAIQESKARVVVPATSSDGAAVHVQNKHISFPNIQNTAYFGHQQNGGLTGLTREQLLVAANLNTGARYQLSTGMPILHQ